MIRIAQASSSENFGKYGTAPNQRRTGATASKPQGNLDGELNVIAWKGGWGCVYRPIDEGIAEKIAQFFYDAVANGSHIGYSWRGNTELFDALKKKGSTDPLDVDTLVNTDCAALAGAAIYFAGIHDDRLRAMTTDKMDTILMSTNAFLKMESKDLCDRGKGIRRGDLVWREGHTACVLDTDESYAPNPMFYFEKHNFNAPITGGTSGTRAAQKVRSVAKKGYRPVLARLSYVSNSALAEVVPFFGYGDESRLCVNFYRASGASGSVSATVTVIFVREELTQI